MVNVLRIINSLVGVFGSILVTLATAGDGWVTGNNFPAGLLYYCDYDKGCFSNDENRPFDSECFFSSFHFLYLIYSKDHSNIVIWATEGLFHLDIPRLYYSNQMQLYSQNMKSLTALEI